MDLAQGAIGFTPGYPCRCAEAKTNVLGSPPGPCGCKSSNGALTIKSCTAGNSLGCSGVKSLTVGVCGGRGPYTWSKTGTVNLSTTTGNQTTVTPPTNAGSAVAGDAYHKYAKFAFADAGTCTQAVIDRTYSCADVETGCTSASCTAFAPVCNNSFAAGCQTLPCVTCTRAADTCSGTGGATACQPASPRCANNSCADKGQGGNMCDVRTAPMIAANCKPCALNEGDTVSVTDALGTVATIIIKA